MFLMSLMFLNQQKHLSFLMFQSYPMNPMFHYRL
jgi:hypothetical protein